jgi:uncharacterized protein YpmB
MGFGTPIRRGISLVLISLAVLLTGCLPPAYIDVPSVRSATLMAKARTPLHSVTDVVVAICPQVKTWVIYGRSADDRQMAVVVGERIYGYTFLGPISWQDALDRVRATGLQPLSDAPMVDVLTSKTWWVRVRTETGSTREAIVDFESGETRLLDSWMESSCRPTSYISSEGGAQFHE